MVMRSTSLTWCNDKDKYETLKGGVSILDKDAFYMLLQNKNLVHIYLTASISDTTVSRNHPNRTMWL